MNKYFLIILFSPSFLLSSQDFRSIKFDSFTPLWTKYVNLSQDNDARSYRLRDHIVDDNNIYLLHNVIKDSYAGLSVDKLNLTTGLLDWNYTYYSNEVGEKEYGANIFMSNNYIHLLSIRNKSKGKYWDDGHIEQRFLDKNSGIVVDSIIRKTGIISKIPNGFNPRIICISPQEENVNALKLDIGYEIFYRYRSFNLTKEGSINTAADNQTLVSNGNRTYQSMSLFKLIDKSKYLLRHESERENIDVFDLDFVHISQSLDSLNSFNLTSLVEPADRYDIVDATEDYILIRSNRINYNGIYLYENIFYYLFDKDGNLLDKASIVNNEGKDKFDGGIAIKDHDENRIVCVYTSSQNDYQTLIFAKSNGLGEFDILREIKSTVKDDNFQCKKIISLTDDIIVNLQHSNQSYIDPYAEKSVWMRCSAQDIYSSTKKIERSKISVFPNPTEGEIHFVTPDNIAPAKIIIRDILGVVHTEIDFSNTIQLSWLSNGIYWLELLDKKNQQLWNQKIIITK